MPDREPAAEAPEARLKRLSMRSRRRGIREMDLILGAFAATALTRMSPSELDLYEQLLAENDHDLYAWIAGRPANAQTGPEVLHPLLGAIAALVAAGQVPVIQIAPTQELGPAS